MPNWSSKTSTLGYSRKQLIALVVFALVFSFGLMAVVVAFFQPGYAGNDDALLASIPSGAFTGEPDGRMVFTGPLIGFPLAGLYLALPDVPWYMYMEYAGMALSLAAAIVVSTILSRRALVPVALGIIFAWLAVFSRWLLNFTFTPVAVLVSSIGVLLLLLALFMARKAGWLIAIGGAFIALGAVLRPELLLGLLAVFAPLLALLMIALSWRNRLALVGGFGSVAIVDWLSRQLAFSGEVWATYLWSDPNRSEILDTPAIGASFLFAEQASLTQNDYSLFYQNGYMDRSVFTPEVMQRLVDITAPATGSGEGLFYAPALMWENFLRYSAPSASLLPIGIAFLIIGLINLRTTKQRLALVAISATSLIWYAGILYYLGEIRKIATHVQLPISYIFLILLLLAPLAFIKDPTYRASTNWQGWLVRAGAALVPAALVYFFFGNPLAGLADQSRANIAYQAKTREFISELRSVDPNAAYVSICCTTPWEGANPKDAEPFKGWPVQIVGGWPPFSPPWERRNEMLGISEGVPKDAYGTTDLVQALISNPKVRLIATEQAAGALSGQMKQYRGWQGCLNPIHRLPNDAVVYQAIAGNCATAPPAA